MAALALVALLQPAAALPQRGADWPCVQARVPSLSVGAAWTGPAIDDVAGAWRQDPEIEGLVERIAMRRTPVDEAERAVTDFLAKAEAAKPDRARLLVAGLFDTLDRERSEVISGLERLTRRQRDFAGTIEADAAKLRELQGQADADQKALADLTMRVEWGTRIFEERRRSVRFACEVPVQIEQRFFLLTRAAQRSLD